MPRGIVALTPEWRAAIADSRKRHGHYLGRHRSPTYNSWRNMKARCGSDRPAYMDVSYCERWERFENFLADMGERPAGMTLDRIDPSGDYTPDNCRWATIKEQRANRRGAYA